MFGIVSCLLLALTDEPVYAKVHLAQLVDQLSEHLLRNYTKHSFPVKQPHAVNVTYGIEVIQIAHFNDREQFITLKTWTRQRWKDELLVWKPEEWDGVEELHMTSDHIWIPDIVLYNNAGKDRMFGEDIYKNYITVRYDGSCRWLNPVTFEVSCPVHVENFPYDKQDCLMKFGSWNSGMSQLNLLTDKAPLITSQYRNSSEWEIESTPVERNEIVYACCPDETFVDVTFHLVLVRKPMYYVFNVIVPCLVLVSSILFGFFLPVESGERVSLTMTILLAVAVFLQIISENLPKNSDSIPVLSVFYLAIMTESACSLITTCVVLGIHYKGQTKGIYPVPGWARRIFLECFAKWYGMEREVKKYSVRKQSTMAKFDIKQQSNCYFNTVIHDDVDGDVINDEKADLNHQKVIGRLDRLYHEMRQVTSIIQENDDHECIDDEWKFLAKVLDRFFFCLFSVTIVCTSIAILLPATLKHHSI